MSAHSPGPWYFHNNAAGYDELRSPNGEVIAMWGDWPALTKADAELIRAAPEMLALLRQCLAEDHGDHRPTCSPMGECFHGAIAVLIKRIDGA